MSFNLLNNLFSTEKLGKEQTAVLNDFDKIIQGVRPLNSRQLQSLPENIRELSHQLTDQRSERRLGYMNENIQLSAYVRYFTWWNLIRLTRLFSNLPSPVFPDEESVKKNGGFCLDLGSGPLTVVTALWIARPELRALPLTWYCLDVSSGSMALGEDVFMSVAAKLPALQPDLSPWKIIRVKGSFGTSIRQKCQFITCANMFNELDQGSQMPPEFQTKKYYEQLHSYACPDASFLLVEPGVPKAARTLSLLRDRFISAGFEVTAPCPHADECPMNGFKSYTGSKNKWCNFNFSTEDAPQKLQKLSTLAKLPKERAVLSFIAAVPAEKAAAEAVKAAETAEARQTKPQGEKATESSAAGKAAKNSKTKLQCEKAKHNHTRKDQNNTLVLRITSDPFRLPKNRTGFYACSALGLTLAATEHPEKITSGMLISVQLKQDAENLPVDFKSGAKIVFI